MNWTVFLSDIGIFGITAAAVTYLIKYTLDKRIKNFENALNHKAEIFKTDLNLDSYKKERLHETRLQIISNLYKKIVHLDFATKEMTALVKFGGEDFDKQEEIRIDRTGKAYNEFLMYYRENEIYFNQETCELLNQLISQYYDALWDYSFERNYGIKNPKNYQEIAKKVTEELPKVLEFLKSDFRSSLMV